MTTTELANDPGEGQLAPGSRVADRYVIDEFLARGGFATVYRAHHHQIGRKLAIKVLEHPHRAVDGDAFTRRFLQEAQLAARIDHPGVVDVFDFGVLDDGRTYIAMDLLDGHDLETQLDRHGAMPASRLIPLFIECLGALAEGHRQGIVHKDLKPSNLFLVKPGTPAERLVILDFGIARVFEDPGARITQDGGFSGTPAYLAPEYIRHQTVTPALDVYQMGLILIELLIGAPAVVAESSNGYLFAHCLQPVVLPVELGDTELGEICHRAIAKDRDRRYQDAGEFREALLALPSDSLRATTVFTKRELHRADTASRTMQLISVDPKALESILQSDQRLSPAVATSAPTIDQPSRKNRLLLGGTLAMGLLTVIATVLLLAALQKPPATPPDPPVTIAAPDPTPVAAVPTVVNAPDAARPSSDATQEQLDAGSEPPGAVEKHDPKAPAVAKPSAAAQKRRAKKKESKPRPKEQRPAEPSPMLLSP